MIGAKNPSASREVSKPCDTGSSSGDLRVRAFPGASLLSERHLAHIWEGQRFPPAALSTRDGRQLGIVYRGRPVNGAGPDFRDAIIAAPWGLLQGDVELHVRASDFRRHGHGRDPAYNGLALHVVFWDDEGEDTLLASGRRAPVAALAPWAERRVEEIRRWLQKPSLWREPCHSALERLGAEAVSATLDGLGQQRFGEKAEAMRRLLEEAPADEVVWQGLLEALGYGGDRQAFRALAIRTPWRQISQRLRWLPARERLDEARRLLLATPKPVVTSRSGQGRPGNAAWRRLEGTARLAVRFCQDGLASSLAAILSGTAEGDSSALLAALSVDDDQRTPSTGLRTGPSAGSGQALIGRGRALEIVVNVVLPYAAACGDAALVRKAEALYGRLPRPAAYGAVRHLDRALRPFGFAQGRQGSGQALRQGSGQALGGAVRVDARRQQGMLRLLRQYCTCGGCGRCPLS